MGFDQFQMNFFFVCFASISLFFFFSLSHSLFPQNSFPRSNKGDVFIFKRLYETAARNSFVQPAFL